MSLRARFRVHAGVFCDVLVIDDDEDERSTVCELLRKNGFIAKGVENGEAGLEFLRSADRLPSLVVLDLLMPGMDGWAVLWAMRHEGALHALPVILMTAVSGQDFMLNGLNVTAYLVKPFEPEELLSVVRKTVERRRRASTQAS